MASLTNTTKPNSSVLLGEDDSILDDILNNQTDDIAVEISPVEGYSEIKMLSSPFGASMLSPGSEIIKNDTSSFCCSSPDNSSTSIGSGTGSVNIPQWKKDLIQRRKSNIARTIGANQTVTCPKKGFLDTLESIKQQKPEDDMKISPTTKITSPVLPLTKSNLYILKSPNNSNNSSINSNSFEDDSNSSEYLDINLHGSPCQQQPANNYVKSTIKTQHKQAYNFHQYDYNNDHDDDENNDHNIDDNIQIEETGISGGQYTINDIKKINKSGNTIIKSPNQQQQQTTTTSQTQNFSIPKQRNILNNQINNSPTGETSLLTTEQLNNKNLSDISNNSSLCSETTSNIDEINSSIRSSDEQNHQQEQQSNKSSMTSSALSGTSSIQLHSKHDTVKLSNIASSSTTNLKTVGLTNNLINNQSINKKCGIVTTSSQLINNNLPNNNNKFIKNTQNSCNQKNKIVKKMVSAQDINESSSTTTNQTQPTIIIDDNDSTSSQFNDFDSSEELQYGPGIVSKLRVRYLSLALRQTTGKQRTPNNLDNLRRATSLNNLLDGGGSTGSTNDGSIIDGDIDNDINVHNHHHHQQQQQQILNHITQQNNQNQQNKIHKNVSWLNDQNSNNFIKKYIEIDDDNDIENSKEFDLEITKNNDGKYIKKPESIYKTGINNYQQNKKDQHIQQQKQRNGRQIKRGNDSLKRARSVEALLCEKSSWLNNSNNKNSNGICGKMSISSCDSNDIGVGEMLLVTEKPDSNEINLIGNKNLNLNQQKLNTKTGTGTNHTVTIEDKIINARERLHNNTEKQSPPKRLTSFIDDTERPPPDLVKQTLKLFEATANRRNGRNLSRNTQNNQVAVKIANYKSIISQEKPTIQYPKPPLSPKRNNLILNKKPPNTLDLKMKTNVTEKKNSPINSPVSSLTKKFSGIDINNELDLNNKFKSSTITNQQSSSPLTPPQILPRNKLLNKNHDDNSISSQRTPDLIPRKHFENLNHNQTTNAVDSPITQLTNKINRMKIQNSPITTPPSSTSTSTDNKNHLTAKSIDELTNDTDSLTSDDDPDGCDIMIKRVSKTALDNISKAGTTQHFSFNNTSNKNDQLNNSTTAKQVGIIRPLLAEPKKDNSSIIVANNSGNSSNGATTSLDNIKPQRDNLLISNLNQTKNQINNNNNSTSKMKLIENSGSVIDKPALTTREIEKNLINEKKNELANLETNNLNDGVTSSPIWQLNKKIKNGSISGGQPIEAQNNIMVFNFQDRKDVPDYIENDGLLIKRRRELPKPNESGFVLLGDLSLETSTDPDDSWTMGPPSPCNVEFENANIIIDGKSNLRYRSKEISLRVQFDDTLTSTFEYPSESSFLDDSVPPPAVESFSNTIDSLEHIDADEIIQIPINTKSTLKSQSPVTVGQKSLGNMSLGSAPLGSYTPIKAQIQTNFELGITRVPNNSNQMNGNSLNDNQQLNGTSKDIINAINNCSENKLENKILTTTTDDTATNNANDITAIDKTTEPESLQYLKPATDDLTVVYSEGTQETDLLY